MLAGDPLGYGTGLLISACFNPRPPLLAGDPARQHDFAGADPGFNPRPPLLAGDPAFPAALAAAEAVSIRARHCWRAIHPSGAGLVDLHGVSIRARHCWRAIRCCSCRTGRRCRCFNPRPPLLAGDPAGGGQGGGGDGVSIRARHCWRAIQRPSGAASLSTSSFNPRPPLLAGDPISVINTDRTSKVSIRARHCWRAIPRHRRRQHQHPHRFNPRPPLLAGDPGQARCRTRDLPGFNPRPPLLAGDPGHTGQSLPNTRVSIRARHCWRAIQQYGKLSHKGPEFQSAPAIAGGRSMITGARAFRSLSFNPRPPLLAGDPCRRGSRRRR